nr:MAG TPA: hypothetical protein [Caudoviricetes sp.]
MIDWTALRPSPSASRRRQVHGLHGGLGVVVMDDRFRLRLKVRRAYREYAKQHVRPPVLK